MPDIHEVATDIYRISVYEPAFDLQFNYFLVRDEDPLLFTMGYRGTFDTVRVDWEYKLDGVPTKRKFWYARGVGLVKSEAKNGTLVLKSFTPGKKQERP